MKTKIYIFFLLISFFSFSQKQANKKVEISSNEIEISTEGLDTIIIENSESGFLEVFLFDENPNKHHILIEETNKIVNIGFIIKSIKEEETVFRKFITERLNRAYVIVKVPQNKTITIFGDNINIESKDYKGNLSIFIEKGNLKLNNVQKDIAIKLYLGTVSARLKNTSIDVVSTIGKITIDDKVIEKSYKKKQPTSPYNFTITSIKANILLTTQKTQ